MLGTVSTAAWLWHSCLHLKQAAGLPLALRRLLAYLAILPACLLSSYPSPYSAAGRTRRGRLHSRNAAKGVNEGISSANA